MDEGRHELDLVLVRERTRTGLRDRLQQVRVRRFTDKRVFEVSHTDQGEELESPALTPRSPRGRGGGS